MLSELTAFGYEPHVFHQNASLAISLFIFEPKPSKKKSVNLLWQRKGKSSSLNGIRCILGTLSSTECK